MGSGFFLSVLRRCRELPDSWSSLQRAELREGRAGVLAKEEEETRQDAEAQLIAALEIEVDVAREAGLEEGTCRAARFDAPSALAVLKNFAALDELCYPSMSPLHRITRNAGKQELWTDAQAEQIVSPKILLSGITSDAVQRRHRESG